MLMDMIVRKEEEEELGEGGEVKGWWNRKGFKRSLTLLGIVVLLVFTTMFLLRKEIQNEKTAEKLTKTTRSNKRQIAAVVGIELGLLGANAFAAKRVIKITQAWRRARIGDVISKVGREGRGGWGRVERRVEGGVRESQELSFCGILLTPPSLPSTLPLPRRPRPPSTL